MQQLPKNYIISNYDSYFKSTPTIDPNDYSIRINPTDSVAFGYSPISNNVLTMQDYTINMDITQDINNRINKNNIK
jgi:hypothetical protein